MKNFLNPKWLIVINTLPLVVLFFLLYAQFSIIKTFLDENNLAAWWTFGVTLVVLGVLNFAYAVFLVIKKKTVSVWFGFIALLCYIPFIYLYGYSLNQIVPASIPPWMNSGNVFLYVGTFLMPTLAYAMFVLVLHFTPEDREHHAWVNFLIAIAIPIAGYLFSQIILPLWQSYEEDFNIHVFLILVITTTLVFLFFLARWIFILAIRNSDTWGEFQLVWKIPIAIILPLLGLEVNNKNLFTDFFSGDSGIFGDFSNNWFYILAFANGVLICLPRLNNTIYRLIVFIGRSITFAFTFYFFLVFLPFLPVSVVAIIAFGMGFLMLIPLLLFIIHINELLQDFSYLMNVFSKKLIIGISIAGFLVIPTAITIAFLKDKIVLNETLSYVYSPDYSKSYHIDKVSLEKTLNTIKTHKDRSNGESGIFGDEIPYLSSYFKWLVLDNLTLSDNKIHTIERIFFGTSSIDLQFEDIQNEDVHISKISSRSTYDTSQKAWKSWVDLEILNKGNSAFPSEYATTIDLPEGCWISDFYLYVGNKKEHGILAEKKSAMWIFSQIRNENRDPGILYYLTGNKVAFRVFPFAKDELRKTGIEFLHKEPVTLEIDNNIVELGKKEQTNFENIQTESVVYVSSQEKQKLKTVKREPYFHFLVDVSKKQKANLTEFISRIEKLLAANQPLSKNAKISFVNSYVTTTSLDKDWKKLFNKQTFDGGFYLDRAIRTTLVQAYQKKSKTYPVMVVVTDSIQNAYVEKDFADLKFTYPESELFFHLDENGKLRAHSLTKNLIIELPEVPQECMFCETVLEYKLSEGTYAFLPNNDQPSIILKKDMFEVPESEIKEKNWKSALIMHGQWTSQILHPEISDQEWLKMVKNSFLSKVLMPVTSYLVVENEAQKAMLKKKQEQVLSGNKSLDPGEELERMSEPSWILLTILALLLLWYKEKRKLRWSN